MTGNAEDGGISLGELGTLVGWDDVGVMFLQMFFPGLVVDEILVASNTFIVRSAVDVDSSRFSRFVCNSLSKDNCRVICQKFHTEFSTLLCCSD